MTGSPSGSAPGGVVFLARVASATELAGPADGGGDGGVRNVAELLRNDAHLLTRLAEMPARGNPGGPVPHALTLLRSSQPGGFFDDDPFGLYWTAPLQPQILFAFLALAGTAVRARAFPSYVDNERK